jgi:hypothetical protein
MSACIDCGELECGIDCVFYVPPKPAVVDQGKAQARKAWADSINALRARFNLRTQGVVEVHAPPAGERVFPHRHVGGGLWYVITETQIVQFVGQDSGGALQRTPELEAAVRALKTANRP